MKHAGVIGGGAWGTALAQVCARAGLETVLWARESDVVASVNTSHENTSFLPSAHTSTMHEPRMWPASRRQTSIPGSTCWRES